MPAAERLDARNEATALALLRTVEPPAERRTAMRARASRLVRRRGGAVTAAAPSRASAQGIGPGPALSFGFYYRLR
jgi:hypothetical protein